MDKENYYSVVNKKKIRDDYENALGFYNGIEIEVEAYYKFKDFITKYIPKFIKKEIKSYSDKKRVTLFIYFGKNIPTKLFTPEPNQIYVDNLAVYPRFKEYVLNFIKDYFKDYKIVLSDVLDLIVEVDFEELIKAYYTELQRLEYTDELIKEVEIEENISKFREDTKEEKEDNVIRR